MRRANAWLSAVALVALSAAACAPPRVASLDDLRARAAAERPEPRAAIPEAPPGFSPPRAADAAVAGRTLEQVATALAPLRDAPDPRPEGPPGDAVVQARDRARRGDIEGAIRSLAEHVQRSPNDLGAWRELARALDASGRRDLGNEAWSRLLVSAPLDAEALASGGIDAAAARRPLVAAERLLRLRQLERVGEAPRSDERAAIGQLVALGLSLREIGHLKAAAECLREAAEASGRIEGADAAGLRRQAGDLRRIEGECLLAAGDADSAAVAFRSVLSACASEDRVALPRLVWALRAAGRPRSAALAVATALADPHAPGREGAPNACAQLASDGVDPWLPPAGDTTALRARLALQDASAVDGLLAASSRLEFSPALRFVAERSGLSAALDRACAVAAARPAIAGEVAAALRALPATASSVRAALVERRAMLLTANFDLLGGDAQSALDLGVLAAASADAATRPWLLAAAIEAAGALEQRGLLLSLAEGPVDACAVASAFAQAFAAVGDRPAADRWAERAIELDTGSADAWIARTRADLAIEVRDAKDRAAQAGMAQARLSAERAWDAQPTRADALRLLLEVLPQDGPQRNEVREVVRGGDPCGAALREIDRADAGRRAQSGQAEPAMDMLRALLLEDPLDAECARALVTAGVTLGQLREVEAWLDALRVRRPAAPALLESAVTAKARQGRLSDGVQAVRQAALDEPESRARRMAWARSLSIAGRDEEAWSVLANGPDLGNAPRVANERAELALRAGREAVAQSILRSVAADEALCESQRLAALGVAIRLPREATGRGALCAAIARPLLAERDIAAPVLAAAMLDGSDEQAAALAVKSARPWTAAVACEGAQMLIDDGLPSRAVALLRASRERAVPAERAAMLRAEVAVLADDAGALAQLQAERARTTGALLLEQEPSSEAREIDELAGCFLLCDRSDAAMRLYEHALAIDPSLGGALNNLAWLRVLAGRTDAGTAELAARALAAQPDDTSTLDTAAWLGYLRGDPIAEVIERLRRATAGPSPGLEPIDHLGDALWAAGDREGAASNWRIVAESASGRGSRALVTEAFNRMQLRRWGVRAWDAASFYDARDGAAIRRAQAKLQAVAAGTPPPVAPRPPAPAVPTTTPASNAPAPTP